MRKLRDMCLCASGEFSLRDVLNSDWLSHIERILAGTADVVRSIEETGASVVIINYVMNHLFTCVFFILSLKCEPACLRARVCL